MAEPDTRARELQAVTLVIPSLNSGGAERVMSIMANHWAARGVKVTLITLYTQDLDFYPLHRSVRRVALELTGHARYPWVALASNIRRVQRLRSEIRQSDPQVVVSFTEVVNVLTLLATRATGLPVIVSERIDPRHHRIGRAWSILRRALYPHADAIVAQTASVHAWIRSIARRTVIHTIPNPVLPRGRVPDGSESPAPVRPANGTVVTVGRLSPQKGFDVLLQAFAECRRHVPGWRLVILGEGEERTRLESMVRSLGLEGAVEMPGRVREPSRVLEQSDLFVLSSHFEGFPNALLEAMSCGLAAISTDCPSGPADIIRHGVDGLLVPPGDVGQLARAMRRLMADSEERKRLGRAALEVDQRFGAGRVMESWEELIGRVAAAV